MLMVRRILRTTDAQGPRSLRAPGPPGEDAATRSSRRGVPDGYYATREAAIWDSAFPKRRGTGRVWQDEESIDRGEERVSASHTRVREAAAARGLDIEIRERPEARSLPEAAELLGIQPSGIVKTLVVKRSDDTYLFALIPGGRAISWPKLRAVVGVNKLRLPESELALAATGYERGTITPIGSSTDWPVFADETIVGQRVAMGAGSHGYSLFVDADELIRAYGATVADISVPE
jgi:Cys-tRNA(Pro) deacylase